MKIFYETLGFAGRFLRNNPKSVPKVGSFDLTAVVKYHQMTQLLVVCAPL